MKRTFLQTSALIAFVMIAGTGCSLSKISWWPWGKDEPAPQPENKPTTIAQHNPGFKPTSTNLQTNPTPPEPKPKPVPAPVDTARNSEDNFKLAQELEATNKLSAAAPFYLRAAEQNLREAQYTVGLMYATGEGLPKDETKAAQWFEKAAVQGLPEAQQYMGIYHENGVGGLAKDFDKAAEWFRKAADQGYGDAQYHLGYLYVKGQGVGVANYTEAAKWFLRAAENNVPDAQYQIGFYLAGGTGVEQNVTEAFKWLTIAKLNHHKRAEIHWAELQDKISDEQKTEGIKLANEFISDLRKKR